MEGGSPVLPCAELSPKVHAIVEAAWQEAGQQAQSQLDPKHQADLKADRELGAEYAAMVEKEEKVSTNQAYIDASKESEARSRGSPIRIRCRFRGATLG